MEQKLKEKVSESIILLHKVEPIAYGLNPHDGFYLGFSGGKGSVVCWQIAKLAGIHFTTVHDLTGIDSRNVVLTGIRRDESFKRSFYSQVVIHPLLDWSEKDVWDFIKEFNLPIKEMLN